MKIHSTGESRRLEKVRQQMLQLLDKNKKTPEGLPAIGNGPSAPALPPVIDAAPSDAAGGDGNDASSSSSSSSSSTPSSAAKKNKGKSKKSRKAEKKRKKKERKEKKKDKKREKKEKIRQREEEQDRKAADRLRLADDRAQQKATRKIQADATKFSVKVNTAIGPLAELCRDPGCQHSEVCDDEGRCCIEGLARCRHGVPGTYG